MPGVMLVTGAGRGIGAAIAREAAKNGFHVCVNYSRSRDQAESLAVELRGAGTEAVAVRADMAREDDIGGLFEEIDRTLGPVTALVNNAGINWQVPIEETRWSDLEKVMHINVFGAFLCAREAVRRMSTRHGGNGGVIVNISSVSARTGGGPAGVIYAASKGAIDTFTAGLAKEVAGDGIRVCAVRPGLTETEIFDGNLGLDVARQRAEAMVPLGRMAKPDEIAGLVVWLCSDAASYVTGAQLDVTGGL